MRMKFKKNLFCVCSYTRQMVVERRMTKLINKKDCIVFAESLSSVAGINAVHKRVPTGRA